MKPKLTNHVTTMDNPSQKEDKMKDQSVQPFELRGMPGFVDSWDYRVVRDDSPEIFGNLSFVPVDRMIAESNEFFDVLDEVGRITRLIQKRDPENIPHPVQDLEDPDPEDEPEDAMDAVDPDVEIDEHTGEIIRRAKEQWDLVFWTEPRRAKDNSVVKVEMSAPVWPKRRWNKAALQDSESIKRAEFMLNQLRKDKYRNGRVFYQEVNKLQKEDRGPLWRAYKLRKKDYKAFRKVYGDPK